MRLDKFLTECSLFTRSEVKKIVRKGRVKVDNVVIKDYSFILDENKNVVSFDDEVVKYKNHYYLLMNKPKGYICSSIEEAYPPVLDLLPPFYASKVFSVGRLDVDTTGCLLLTDDGKFSHALLSPTHHVSKVYRVTVDKPLKEELVKIFADGFEIEDGLKVLPSILEILDPLHALLTIGEGKYHQVKRMFRMNAYEVMELNRDKFAFLTTDNLQLGEFRELTDDELKRLKELSSHEGGKL